MSEWTDNQLITILKSIRNVDGGCPCCITTVLRDFLDIEGWDLLKRFDNVVKDEYFENEYWKGNHKWENIRPIKKERED